MSAQQTSIDTWMDVGQQTAPSIDSEEGSDCHHDATWLEAGVCIRCEPPTAGAFDGMDEAAEGRSSGGRPGSRGGQ